LENIFDVGACGSYIGTRIVTFFGRPRGQEFAAGLGHDLGRSLPAIAIHLDNRRWHDNRWRRESGKARC